MSLNGLTIAELHAKQANAPSRDDLLSGWALFSSEFLSMRTAFLDTYEPYDPPSIPFIHPKYPQFQAPAVYRQNFDPTGLYSSYPPPTLVAFGRGWPRDVAVYVMNTVCQWDSHRVAYAALYGFGCWNDDTSEACLEALYEWHEGTAPTDVFA